MCHSKSEAVCIWIIIGSDRRPQTRQLKIVRFSHFWFIISFHRHFVQFVNLNHVILKHGVGVI